MFKRIAAILVAVTLMLGLAVAPAQAMPGEQNCGPGQFVCVFTGANFTGNVYAWSESQFAGTCVPMQGSFNNTMSSFILRLNYTKVRYYDGNWCTGAAHPTGSWFTPAGTTFWQYSMAPGYDNWASSFLLAIA